MLNFDQHAINSSTFDLTQFALDKAAVEYSLLGNSAILIAVGDSAASPHYYSGSGMSTGRIGIERALNLAKQYKDGNIAEIDVLIDKLNESFEKIKAQVLALGKDYVKSRSAEEIDRIAMETMCFAVNK
uniref:Uncharacterized protein n=1 Tax=Ditylenchus dipsaci TaxID=166011 RepID=A0A915D903_9BILA